MQIKVKKLCDNARLPLRATEGSAAYDIYSCEDAYLFPGRVVKVRTGLVMEIPHGWKGVIYPRSGLSSKGIFVANPPGKIDSDYRGEVMVLLYNSNQVAERLQAGERIAQFEIEKVHDIDFRVVNDVEDTERGSGGFGSTGQL